MPVSSRTSRTAVACGFSPASTRPLGRVNTARLRLRGDFAGAGVSFCGSVFCGSIKATCQTPEICRSTTPPAEISRVIALALADTVSGIPKLPSLLLDSLPSPFHMAGLSVGLADAESKREFAIKLGMREVEVATAIQPLHQELIGMILVRTICRAQAGADEVEPGGRGEFEARIVAHPGGELLGQTHVLANVVLQAFDPVMPDHEPKLERTKTAPELDVPVAIINDSARFSGLVAQVLR